MKNIFSIVKFTALLVVLFSVIYTMAILGIAQFAPNKGKGETISVNGKVVGYQKIGQKFDKPNYFWDDHRQWITMPREAQEVTKDQAIQSIWLWYKKELIRF